MLGEGEGEEEEDLDGADPADRGRRTAVCPGEEVLVYTKCIGISEGTERSEPARW